MSLINDDTYGDSTIRLKTLEKEYDVLLKQYLEAKKTYIESLEDDASGEVNYTINPSTWLRGDISKVVRDIASATECKSLCIENKCGAAGYVVNDKICVLHGSSQRFDPSLGQLIPMDDPNYVTIVPRKLTSLAQMGEIIFKLLSVNRNIIQTIENIDPTYQENIEAKKIRADELYANYKNLIGERDMVNSKMDEYSMLTQKFTDENINANKQYNLVSVWGFIVFLILLFALREIFQIPISFIPVFIGALVFFLGLNLGVPTGFLIWLGIIGLLIFLYFINMS